MSSTSAASRASSISTSSRATRGARSRWSSGSRPAIWCACASRPSARTPRAAPLPLALELGPQAAMVVMDPATRQVLALVGGYDFHPGGFDRAQRGAAPAGFGVQAVRLRGGDRVAEDHRGDGDQRRRPRSMRCGSRRTTRRRSSWARCACATALAHSINTVSIKVLSQVGLPDARAVATRVGHHVAASSSRRGPGAGARARSR